MIRSISIALMLGILCACTNVLWVKRNAGNESSPDYKKMPGIPFYAKTLQFKHASVYVRTWLRVTLTVEKKTVDTKDGKEVLLDGSKQIIPLDLRKEDAKLLAPIRIAIINANTKTAADAVQFVKDFSALPAVTSDDGVPPVLIKNVVESELVVDNDHRYYLNAPLPWFGTGNLTQELNPDGTLSKVTSNPDTKLAEGISALLPLKEYLTGEFVQPSKTAVTDPSTSTDANKGVFKMLAVRPSFKLNDGEFVYVLSLSVEEVGREYTMTTKPEKSWPSTIAIALDDSSAMMSRRDLGTEEKPLETKEEGSTVGISGSIKFPKGWGTSGADDAGKGGK
jgi:hypothetical protein